MFIWAIPILGFIGTVIGISNAVGGFSGTLDQAQDIEVLKDSLNAVTMGLAVAFDTTLVALIMSLIISIPVGIVQKREEDFLGEVDDYCSEHFLKRINDAGGTADIASNTKAMMTAIGNAISQDQQGIVERLVEAQERMGEMHSRQIEYYESSAKSMQEDSRKHISRVEDEISKMSESVHGAVAKLVENSGTLVDSQVKRSDETVAKHLERVEKLMERIAEPVDKVSAAHIEGVTSALDQLNGIIENLGGKKVEIQPPARRGLFSKFRR